MNQSVQLIHVPVKWTYRSSRNIRLYGKAAFLHVHYPVGYLRLYKIFLYFLSDWAATSVPYGDWRGRSLLACQ
jgi:hypothetical protein